jgi:hypothetical protein
MGQHFCIQTQPIEHLGQISPSAIRRIKVGHNIPLCDLVSPGARSLLPARAQTNFRKFIRGRPGWL